MFKNLLARFRRQPEPEVVVELSPLAEAMLLRDQAMSVFHESVAKLQNAMSVLLDEIQASKDRQDELTAKAREEKELRNSLAAELESVEAQIVKIEKIIA